MGQDSTAAALRARADRQRLRGWLCACLLLCAPLLAAGPGRFQVYDADEGLSQASVGDLLQDRSGFLWLGTQDGLNRFDGREFVVHRHDPAKPATLDDNYISALAEDAGGDLWIGTQSGLNRRRALDGHIERHPVDLGGGRGDPFVIDVWPAADGQLLVTTRGHGVRAYEPETRRWRELAGVPAFKRRQRLLHGDGQGPWLLASDEQLLRLAPDGSRSEVLFADLDAGGGYTAVAGRPGGGYALGTLRGGLRLIDTEGRLLMRLDATLDGLGLPDAGVRALLYDQAGRLWIGTVGGLARLDPDGTLQRWRHRAGDARGLPGDRISALLLDRTGLVWVGTWTGGLARIDPEGERFRVLGAGGDEESSLPAASVPAIASAADGSLWVGMVDGGGLARVDPAGRISGLWRTRDGPEPRLQQDDVHALLAEERGLWVGYAGGGLDLRGEAGLIRRELPRGRGGGLPDASVKALARDRAGTLWVGTQGGLHSLCADCEAFVAWPSDPDGRSGPRGNYVNQILETRDGRLWFAMRRAGLSWFDRENSRWGGIGSHRDSPVRLPHENVTSLYEDAGGTLWVGTQGGGACRLSRSADGGPAALACLGEAEGLASAMIGAIAGSRDGRIWFATTRGVCSLAAGASRAACHARDDPALGADFYVGAVATGLDGRVHLGSASGLVSLPASLEPMPAGPGVPLVYTEIRVGNQPVHPGPTAAITTSIENAPTVRLRHDQDLVSIAFAALDYRRAPGLAFRYRLAGRDADWTLADPRRPLATYTGLASGRYRLIVEAMADDTVAGRNEIAIEVLEAPWLSYWARIGYALALLLVGGFLAWRMRLRRRERERSRDALAQSEALLKHSLWGSRAELWDADLVSGRLARRNRLEHLEVTRKAAAETLRAYAPFVHADDRATFDAALAACVQGEQDYFECSYRTRAIDGDWRWMLSRGRVYSRDASGRAQRMIGTTFDITDLRRNEERLVDSERRLKLALWGSGDEMWDIDLRSGEIRRENTLAQTALGSELRFPHMKDYLEFVHPLDQARVREAFVRHIKGDVDHFSCSYRIAAVGGGWVWVLGKGRVVERDGEGHALRMLGTNRDISQLMQVEEELRTLNEELELRVTRRTEALERANRELKETLAELTRTQRQLVESEKLAALGGLVAGVAHEINTPLGVAVTAASHLEQESQVLERTIEEGRMTRSALAEFLQHARQGAQLVLRNLERAGALVKSFKQVAVDQASEQRRVFRLEAYLGEILTSLRPRLKGTQLRTEVECPPELVLDTYPGALYQIIANLLVNALVHAYTPGQAGCIRIVARAVGEDIHIEFADDGAGMPEAVRRRIFEPFFTTRRGSGGSGLGLHIAYNLATQILGGRIECESRPGQGTRFWLQFPRVATSQAPAAPAGGA
jgi:signal transduction histidine kinase/ligand-binding sensor domain-containing protein